MDHGLRRANLAASLDRSRVSALLVTHLPNVRYLTGFTGSNGQLLVSEGTALLLTDGRYEEQAAREVPDLERRVRRDGLTAAAAEVCRELGLGRVGLEADGLTYGTYSRLARVLDAEIVPVEGAVESLRRVKDTEEVQAIERAQELTEAGLEAVVPALREGVSEREVGLELEVAMRRAGADGIAFDPIVAFGENAAEPHHVPGERSLRRGDLVKLDFGARSHGYHADMTRMLSLGEPPALLREVYEAVLAAHLVGVRAARAGTRAADVDAAARRVIETAGYEEAFVHGLGHGVGLEIHEGPWLRKTSEDVLLAGTVVTVEPGVYLPGVGGVRIEDMVVVGDDGARVLPRATKELIVL